MICERVGPTNVFKLVVVVSEQRSDFVLGSQLDESSLKFSIDRRFEGHVYGVLRHLKICALAVTFWFFT